MAAVCGRQHVGRRADCSGNLVHLSSGPGVEEACASMASLVRCGAVLVCACAYQWGSGRGLGTL